MRSALLFMSFLALSALSVQQWQARPDNHPADRVYITRLHVTKYARAPLPVLPPLAALSQTRRRPLFQRGRGAPSPAASRERAEGAVPVRVSAPRPLPVTPPPFTLRAVAITASERFVLLRDSRTGNSITRHVGEQFGGWRLAGIGPGHVVVARDGVTRTLELRHFRVEARADQHDAAVPVSRGVDPVVGSSVAARKPGNTPSMQ